MPGRSDYSAIRAALSEELQRERERIYGEIHNYPPPIPACDAQFNHLIQQRSAVTQELRTVQNLPISPLDSTASRAALRQAIADSEILDAAVKERLLVEVA